MKVWREQADFLTLLRADSEVSAALGAEELAELFDLGYHTKHVNTLFQRIFGE